MSIPHFPQVGEPWVDCHICGFSIPRSEAVRHYKSKRLVCQQDADERSHLDFMAELELPPDRVTPPSEQRVADQGPVPLTGLGYGQTPYGDGLAGYGVG